jgi:hypothetical protein
MACWRAWLNTIYYVPSLLLTNGYHPWCSCISTFIHTLPGDGYFFYCGRQLSNASVPVSTYCGLCVLRYAPQYVFNKTTCYFLFCIPFLQVLYRGYIYISYPDFWPLLPLYTDSLCIFVAYIFYNFYTFFYYHGYSSSVSCRSSLFVHLISWYSKLYVWSS